MSSTFESVLNLAEKLDEVEKARLISALSNPPTQQMRNEQRTPQPAQNDARDDAVIAALRAWVDEIESSPDPKRRTSARISERIRKKNDRGYKL